MPDYALIGGTGLTKIQGLEIIRREMVHTPFGAPSGPLIFGKYCNTEIVFLARHGYGHTIPPHEINYRANIWALNYTEVKNVIAIASVGGIGQAYKPGELSIPEQIIDYTYAREQTFHQGDLKKVTHIDFTHPYCEDLRQDLLGAARSAKIEIVDGGVYAATQGPRLETAAEINRLEKDGCDIVGMTGMPEASLAREMDLCYASVAVVANWAAGRGTGKTTLEGIEEHLRKGMEKVLRLMTELF